MRSFPFYAEVRADEIKIHLQNLLNQFIEDLDPTETDKVNSWLDRFSHSLHSD